MAIVVEPTPEQHHETEDAPLQESPPAGPHSAEGDPMLEDAVLLRQRFHTRDTVPQHRLRNEAEPRSMDRSPRTSRRHALVT